MSFRRKPTEPTAEVAALVVGLGNPGSAYRGTRHNIGFVVADALASRLNTTVSRKEGAAQVGRGRVAGAGADVVIAKPQTFMNLSGKSVSPMLRKYGLGPQDLWVIHDDIDLPFGRLRIRPGGSAGGHNGLTSIIEALGGNRDFIRLRLGVGRPDPSQAVDYVLGRFEDAEIPRVDTLVGLTVDAIVTGLAEGLEMSMNRFNGKSA
ncbi:MAG: aminoacyl-tRNA hydrolase [Candidatus Dormibacteria bacterium]